MIVSGIQLSRRHLQSTRPGRIPRRHKDSLWPAWLSKLHVRSNSLEPGAAGSREQLDGTKVWQGHHLAPSYQSSLRRMTAKRNHHLEQQLCRRLEFVKEFRLIVSGNGSVASRAVAEFNSILNGQVSPLLWFLRIVATILFLNLSCRGSVGNNYGGTQTMVPATGEGSRCIDSLVVM